MPQFKRTRARMNEAVQKVLEPGEQIVATVDAWDGPNPMLMQAALGALIRILITKHWWLAGTDRRLIFVKASQWRSRASEKAFAEPYSSIKLEEVKRGGMHTVLRLRLTNGTLMRLNVHRFWRADADKIVGALGGAPAGAPETS